MQQQLKFVQDIEKRRDSARREVVNFRDEMTRTISALQSKMVELESKVTGFERQHVDAVTRMQEPQAEGGCGVGAAAEYAEMGSLDADLEKVGSAKTAEEATCRREVGTVAQEVEGTDRVCVRAAATPTDTRSTDALSDAAGS